jgi:hypothetical protein
MIKNDNECKTCSRSRNQVRLVKCIICLEPFCRACGFLRHGKAFCSRSCAEVFFFGDADEG